MSAVRAVEDCWAVKRLPGLAGQAAAPLRQAINPVVAAVFAVDIQDLRAATRRSAQTAFARQVAMYLAHVVCGLSLTEVGSLFARDRTTVAHACGVVEDRRADPELDLRLEHVERAVASWIDALALRGACL